MTRITASARFTQYEVPTALLSYMGQSAFPAGGIGRPPTGDDRGYEARVLTVAETEAELGAYHLWKHDILDSRPLVQQALKDDPNLGCAHEENGFLLFRDGNDAAATQEFSQAFTLDPSLYLSLFAKTMLSPISQSDSPVDEAAFKAALLQVLNLDPQFAPAYVELARLAVRQGSLTEALSFSSAAENLEPWRSGYHIQTGWILLRIGKGDEAARFANFVAPRWFGSDHNEAVELWNATPAAQRAAPDDPIVAVSPHDTQSVEGIVKFVDCPAPPAEGQSQRGKESSGLRLILRSGDNLLTFRGNGPFNVGFTDTI